MTTLDIILLTVQFFTALAIIMSIITDSVIHKNAVI